MSSKALIQLDKDITEAIAEDAPAWRKEFSNIMTHVVTMKLTDVKKQIWAEMALREGYDTENILRAQESVDITGLEKIINKETPNFLSDYWDTVTTARDRKNNKYIVTSLDGSNAKNFTFQVSQPEGETGDIFNYIKGWKSDPQRPLIKAINKWAISKRGSRRGEDVKGDTKLSRKIGKRTGRKKIPASKEIRPNDSFVDFGHVGASAVSSQRSLKILDMLQNYGGAAKGKAQEMVESLSKAFGFEYTTSTDFGGQMEKILTVTLESSRLNKATMTKGEVTNLENLLIEALGKVAVKRGKPPKEYWVMAKGSDSFFDMVAKDQVAAIVSKLTKNKNVKIKTKIKYKKRKNSKKTVKGAQRKRKVTHVKGPAYKLPKKSKKPAEDERREAVPSPGSLTPAMSPLSMIGMINKELPAAVEGNMGRPRLESVTGRLARSVRLTDVINTPQGFPSFGYTYDLSPYQTFEAGGVQGSDDYDPRRLIDQSIRAVAAKVALGRFYTRRVQ